MSIRLEDLEKKLLPLDKGHCVTTDQRVLYNIQVLLTELLNPIDTPTVQDKCPHCGKVHKNAGEKLSCAKKHKKKG